MRVSAKHVAYAGVSAALVYIATSISIPMPPPLGVWHLGDIASLIVAILFGPYIGAFACGVGAMLFDVYNPLWGSQFIVWAPATIVIRGVLGLLVGFLRSVISRYPKYSEIIAMAIGVTEKNFGYFLYDFMLFGPVAYMDLVTFFPLDAVSIVVTIPLLAAIRASLRVQYLIPPPLWKGSSEG